MQIKLNNVRQESDLCNIDEIKYMSDDSKHDKIVICDDYYLPFMAIIGHNINVAITIHLRDLCVTYTSHMAKIFFSYYYLSNSTVGYFFWSQFLN